MDVDAVIRVEPRFWREMESAWGHFGFLRFLFTGPLPGFPLQRGWPWVITGFEPGQTSVVFPRRLAGPLRDTLRGC